MEWICLIGNSFIGATAAVELGFKVNAIVDKNSEINKSMSNIVEITIAAELQNYNSVKNSFEKIIAIYGKPILIINFSENGQFVCELLRQEYGFSYNAIQTVEMIMDKYLMRQKLNELASLFVTTFSGNISDIYNFVLNNTSQSNSWVIKPRNGVGSRDINFIYDYTDLEYWKKSYINSNINWIIEEKLIGREFSIEAVSTCGNTHIIGITEKIINSNAVEVGHIFPAKINEQEFNTISHTVKNALAQLNVTMGATHTEVILESNTQCKIVESHLRPGGDEIPYLAKCVTGICQYKMAILLSLGQLNRIQPSEPIKAAYASIALFEYSNDNSGFISEVHINRELQINCNQIVINLDFSKQIQPTKDSFSRYGYVIYNTDNYEQALNLCLNGQRLLQIQVN